MKMNCAPCKDKTCSDGEMKKTIDTAFMEKYDNPEERRMFEASSEVEAEGYMQLTRIEEIILFAGKMNYKRLGIAFCEGLEEEAKVLYDILKQRFKVSSACCKICGVSKEEMNLKKIEEGRFEAMCNPIGQAEILKECGTEMNIVCGLCVGHDMLFNRHSAVPVTTFIVKDRILTHNPAASLYSKYYRKKLIFEEKQGGSVEK